MSTSQSGVSAHDTKVAAVESVLEAAITLANTAPVSITATNPGPSATVVRTATIAFHTAVLASALLNNVSTAQAREALHELGVWI